MSFVIDVGDKSISIFGILKPTHKLLGFTENEFLQSVLSYNLNNVFVTTIFPVKLRSITEFLESRPNP